LTLNNSAIRGSGDSLSPSWRHERETASCECGHGTTEPVSSLQYIMTGEFGVSDEFEATAADHIS
jgi:hypothetical protein